MKRMMHNRFVPLWFFFALFLLSGFNLRAQLKTNTNVLLRASAQARLEEKAMANRLLTMAKAKGWPLTISNKSGHRAILSGIACGAENVVIVWVSGPGCRGV